MKEQLLKLSLTLAIIGIVASAALGATYSVTKDPIEEANAEAELEACEIVLPGVTAKDKVFDIDDDGNMVFSGSVDEGLGKRLLTNENKALKDGLSTVYFSSGKGYIFVVSSRGYKDAVINAVGVDTEGRITKISNISNKETANLGTKALEERYLDKTYGGKTLDESTFTIGKGIDGITGATITSKAVAKDSALALEAYVLFSTYGSPE